MAIEAIDLSEARHSLPVMRRFTVPRFGGRRSFKAGNVSRLTLDWPTSPIGINAMLWSQGLKIRTRARHQTINDPYMAKFSKLCRNNIVGHKGITLQAKVKSQRGGKLNTKLNVALETGWKGWGNKLYCTKDRRFGLVSLQQFLASQMPADGEFFIQRVFDKANPYGFSVRIIDPDQLDISYSVERLTNGNMVVMGVELDSELAPVAYWFFDRNPYEISSLTRTRIRVPASEVIHYFVPQFPGQVRGYGWAVPSMYRLNMLSGYEDAEVTAARAGASKMGFYVRENGSTEYVGEDKDPESGDFLEEAEPGVMDVLPQGYKFQSYDPQHPTQAYQAFMKTALRGVASGWGVSYSSLASDLEGANYSSMRVGRLDECEEWKFCQSHFIENCIETLFRWWLEASVLKGAIDITGYTQEQICASMVWTGRRWPWVDPQKDITAAVLGIANKLQTYSGVLAEQGMDFEETVDQIAYEMDYMTKKGVQPNAVLGPQTPQNGTDSEGDSKEDDKEDDEKEE